MDQCEDREDRVPPSKTTLCGEHEDQSKVQSPEQLPDSPEPEPSCVSFRSSFSKERGIDLNQRPSVLSRNHPEPKPEPRTEPGPSCVSFKSDWSKDNPLVNFKSQNISKPEIYQQTADSPESEASGLSFRTVQRISEVPKGSAVPQHQIQLDSIFKVLEIKILTYAKNELKKIHKVLCSDYPEYLKSPMEDKDDMDEEKKRSSREAFLKITQHFLRNMKQEELADLLQSKTYGGVHQHHFKSGLKKKFQCVFEGIAKAGSPTLLNQIYTELYITEGGTGE
ncbi:hypothetical protein ATANTOWER_015453, partial [Ataeniobius toweri]|nr:hypothetical protein [Ataeniobius toweri]